MALHAGLSEHCKSFSTFESAISMALWASDNRRLGIPKWRKILCKMPQVWHNPSIPTKFPVPQKSWVNSLRRQLWKPRAGSTSADLSIPNLYQDRNHAQSASDCQWLSRNLQLLCMQLKSITQSGGTQNCSAAEKCSLDWVKWNAPCWGQLFCQNISCEKLSKSRHWNHSRGCPHGISDGETFSILVAVLPHAVKGSEAPNVPKYSDLARGVYAENWIGIKMY